VRLLLVLLALTVAACDPQVIDRTVYVTEAAPAPAVEDPALPAVPPWAPEVLHVYVMDKDDLILWDETETAESYSMRLYVWQLTAELQCRDYPADPWHVVGGGVS
jgi:hypothetical protein